MDETPIEIVEYDPAWRDRFEDERERLDRLVGDRLARIDHVGSTAVPGLAAKPIVDVTAVVADVEGLWGDLDSLTTFLGYEVSHHPADWLFLQRGDDDPACNLHLIPEGSDAWKRDLQFREYLRSTPAARAEYESAKRAAADAHPDDIDAYSEAKADVCESILDRALADDETRVPPPDREREG